MKAQILATALLIGTSSLASAAEPGMPMEEPPVVTWTGFYAGINGGGAWTNGVSLTYVDLANTGNTNNAYQPSTVEDSDSGGLLGVHAGYNWQTASNWVVGFEADWDWTNLSVGGTNQLIRAVNGTVFTDNVSMGLDINWLATLRGRLGYASDNWLFYATGGVAVADVDFTAQVNCLPIGGFCGGGAQVMNAAFNDTRVGAAIGGGVEFRPAANWSFGVQYLYSHFGDGDLGGGSWITAATGAPAPFFECGIPGENCAQFSSDDIGLHTITARLTYHFN